MINRFALLLTAALGMAAAQTAPAPTSPLSLPSSARIADPQLSGSAVTFEVRRTGSDLASMLIALAMSAGYEIIIEPSVDAVLKANSVSVMPPGTPAAATDASNIVGYSFKNKPFNEVWPLVLDIYGLSYESLSIGSKPVLRVGIKPIQKIVRLPSALSAAATERQLKLSFGSLKQITSSQTNAAGPQASASTTEATQEEIILDSPTMRIVAEPTSNSIIIRGTNQEVAQVERLLSQIIAAQNNGQASPVTAVQPPQIVQRVYTVKGQQDDISAVFKAQYPELRITPVGTTGQLILSGTQTQIDAALALVAQVDRAAPVAAGAQTVQRVFTLINASAEEVKATLEGTLARDLTPATPNLANVPVNATDANGNAVTVTVPTTKTSAGQTDAAAQKATPAATTPDGATIIADVRTNSLIVRGTQTQVEQIAELVPQLDRVVPQINVQVRIQEINETAARSLGVDWKLGFGGFNVSLGGGGLAASFDPTRSLVGFNLGPTLNALESQGMSKSVYDGSVTMQSGQRSLGGGGNTQNASSAAAASIKSGGRLELNIPSSAGNIEKQIDYGVNLDFFSPQVAPDGSITLRVRGQVNSLTSPIPETGLPNVLQFTNSEAQSLITFKSGQTVLLSGLLSTKESNTKAGTPFLSSLPVIGAAFGKQSTNRTQSQLLVVITGTIVQ
ncbi:secretin N-terminal domain-containing protein [Deinococcus aerophilus]|uniref:Type IV piliation system protein n=1 Tax=Deinococcus aerophilus TaxID=522488 RepID=A0ABQ2GT73_9DEIO|nr:secretin N-terminal domain-containing protein [Deinococcus aerophilus]GGM10705.1 putative type IV piliation system protein [Deinococcus aerophilus]